MFQWVKNLFKGAGKEVWEVAKQATGEAVGKGIHEGVKIAVEKITVDPHGELVSEIKRLLEEENRRIMFSRLLRHTAEHRENRTANLLIKIPREQREEIFEWLCWLNDEQFEQVLDLLENNRVEEFFARNWAKISPKIEPFKNVADRAARDLGKSLNAPGGLREQTENLRDRLRDWALR